MFARTRRNRFVNLEKSLSNRQRLSRTFRPHVEALEDRVVPSIQIVSAPDPSLPADLYPQNSQSNQQAISADGRYVAFSSYASNLAPGDTNGFGDVFVRDLQTGGITLVSTDVNGTQGNENSDAPAISADGRYVAFSSRASNLVPNDTNGKGEVFVRDLVTGVVTLVSTDGIKDNSDSSTPAISADGRYVAFKNAVSSSGGGKGGGGKGDGTPSTEVFVKDLLTGTLTLVSSYQGDSFDTLAISADGRYVAFSSDANNLVPDDTNYSYDIFLGDVQTGDVTLVSTDVNGTQGNDSSCNPAISGDGRYVAFISYATNLVTGASNGNGEVFVKDLQTGDLTLVSTDSSGNPGNSNSYSLSLSADGRYVAFSSYSSNLVADDTNNAIDVFVKDWQQTGAAVTLVSSDGSGNPGNDYSDGAAISADGHHVAFYSNASNLVPDETSGNSNVFVWTSDTTVSTTTAVVGSSPNASVYGDPVTFTATVTSDSGTPTGTVTFAIDGVDQAPVTLSGGQAVYTTSALVAGSHTVTATYGGNATFPMSSGTLSDGQTVNPAPLTVTADPASRVYGSPNPAFTAALSGFVNGETPASLGGSLSFVTPATPDSPLGSYPITPQGLTSTNYDIQYQDGTLTVTNLLMQGGSLLLGGTAGDDTLTFTPGTTVGSVVVKLNGSTLGTFTPTSSILAYGGPGNDTVIVNGTRAVNNFTLDVNAVSLDSLAYLGDRVENWTINALGSSDTITALGGSATINGGGGKDQLIAAMPGEHTWNITAQNAGTLNGTIVFTSVASLTGGAGVDVFHLADGVGVSGAMDRTNSTTRPGPPPSPSTCKRGRRQKPVGSPTSKRSPGGTRRTPSSAPMSSATGP